MSARTIQQAGLAILLAWPCSGQVVPWAKRGGGATEDYGWGISATRHGHAIVAGHFTGPAEFGGPTLKSFGGLDVFVANYDTQGNLVWITPAGGSGDDDARAVATDPQANVYVTGNFVKSASFGSVKVESAAAVNSFYLAKLNEIGSPVWVARAAGTGSSDGHGVATAINGVYVSGFFNGTVSFGTNVVSSRGAADAFLARYSNEGQLLWVQSAGGAKLDDFTCLATSRDGGVVAAGTFRDSVQFRDGTTLLSYGGGDILVAKFRADGSLVWAQAAGAADQSMDLALGVAVDFDGAVYVTGSIQGIAKFGRMTLAHAGGGDMFVAKYSGEGDLLWARSFGASGPDQGHSVRVDANGDVYVAAFCYDTVGFDSFQLNSPNHTDACLIKLTPNGKVIWAWQAGGTAYKSANSLAVTPEGISYLTGFFRGTTQFGGFTLTNNFISNRDPFIARVDGPETGTRLRVSNAGELNLWWRANASDLVLEAFGILAPESRWNIVTNQMRSVEDYNLVTDNPADPRRFYRLRAR